MLLHYNGLLITLSAQKGNMLWFLFRLAFAVSRYRVSQVQVGERCIHLYNFNQNLFQFTG